MAPSEASALEALNDAFCKKSREALHPEFTLLDFGSSVDFGAWSSGSGAEARGDPKEATCKSTPDSGLLFERTSLNESCPAPAP